MTIRHPDESAIKAAAERLHLGEVIAFPTETVYGLGADATQDSAVAKVFSIKGRPAMNPLIVHVGRPDWVAGMAVPDGRFDSLTRAFWPGPLTLVLKRRPDCPIADAVSAGLDTIAVRQPNHPVAQSLLKETKRPLAAPSANPSGHVSPTTAEHVAADLCDHVEIILNGGPCATGIESTVLDLSGDVASILRPGAVDAAALQAVIGPIAIGESGPVKAPGQLEKHYAPALPVRLNAEAAQPGEAFIGFGDAPGLDVNLSSSGNLEEAAAALFATLRRLDDPDRYSGIAVTTIPNDGVGKAINDRLSRAAKGR